MRRSGGYRVVMGSVAALIGIVAVGGCVGLVQRRADVEVLVCLMTVPFLFALAGCGSKSTGAMRWGGWVVLGSSLVMLFCFLLGGLNFDLPTGPVAEIFCVSGSVVALYLGFGLVLWGVKQRSRAGRVGRRVVMGLGAVVTAALVYEVIYGSSGLLGNPGMPDTLYLGVPLILLCGMLAALPFVDRAGAADAGESEKSLIHVEVVCPRCGKAQSMKAGKDACGVCGLEFAIDIQPPYCRCGYLLVGIESDVCPECGRDARGKAGRLRPRE